jgi:hypothetical protein
MDSTFDCKLQVEDRDLLDKTVKKEEVKAAHLLLSQERESKRERARAYSQKWRRENPEKVKLTSRKKWSRDAEQEKERNKAWILANPDRAREINKKKTKKYALNHPEKVKKRRQAYYAANVCKFKAYRVMKAKKLKAYFKWYNREKRGCVECKSWPDWQQGHKQYDNHCFRCFARKFPSDPRTQNRARAELLVREYINSKWTEFAHDNSIETAHCACTHRRRVDHRKLVGDTLLCIETDDHWHRRYKKHDEDARYHDITMAWGGKLLFIRINPDGKGPPIEKRLEKLGTAIEVHLKRIEAGENTTMLEVWHLYYPAGTPDYYDESVVPGWLEAWQSVQAAAAPAAVDGACDGGSARDRMPEAESSLAPKKIFMLEHGQSPGSACAI